MDISTSVAVLSAYLEALQKNGTLLQIGVKFVLAKLELDLLMHTVNRKRRCGIIGGYRDSLGCPSRWTGLWKGSCPLKSC
ncbi:hypothetical protein BKA64DRAFT_673186 [Cadophora sp. MPI-SDFR-AT-0126]|nr:hypothetical protein BKA64DRAFT_673186 [Leotiomycetes sp. MPI-SDFR-AT-0126]